MRYMPSDTEVDLLEALVQNSRFTPRVIGKLLGKSRNWVSRKIKALVKSGVIRGYTTIVNPTRVKTARDTILFMKSNPREQDVSRKVLLMDELESLDGVVGEFSLIGFFRFDSDGSFEDLLDRVDNVVASSKSGKYQLAQILSTYKKNRCKIVQNESTDTHLSSKEIALLRIMRYHKATTENPFPLSQEAIGRRMNPPMRQPAVSKAINKLLMKRAIAGYSIDIDFGNIGLPVKFFVRMKVSPGTAGITAQHLMEMDEVWDLYRTSEDFSFLATVRTRSIDAFNTFLRNLYQNENVIDTHSYVSLEEWPLHPS